MPFVVTTKYGSVSLGIHPSFRRRAHSSPRLGVEKKYSKVSRLLDNAHDIFDEFSESGELEDLENAISLYRQVLVRLPARIFARFTALDDLAEALESRYSRTDQLEDVDEAVSLHREALSLLPLYHASRPMSLNNLAAVLDTRFSHAGQIEDIDEAIALHREALKLRSVHPDRSNSLNNLGHSLEARFSRTNRLEDIDEAVSLHRDAIQMRPVPHPDRSMSLNNLGNALEARYSQTGRSDDVDEAISLHREALSLLPASHPERPAILTNLSVDLDSRYQQTGQVGDIDEVILLSREALGLLPASNPARSSSLHSLAHGLHNRFSQIGLREDLDEAIKLHREALLMRPGHHYDRSDYLSALASALEERFFAAGISDDIDEAISLHREALSMPCSQRPISLSNLAVTLETRFRHQMGNFIDIDEAISLLSEAIGLFSTSHPDRLFLLNNLANAFDTRFSETRQSEDIDRAIFLHREALELTHDAHPHKLESLNNLANAFANKFECLRYFPDLEEAVSTFRAATQHGSGPSSRRFRAAQLWASHAHGHHESGLEAYQAAIQLLSRLAMLGLDLQSRHQLLASRSDGLACNAAVCAIQASQLDKAVELLEEGRSVLWSQALQLRNPLDRLRAVAPDLAQKIKEISHALEQASLRDVSRDLSGNMQQIMSMEKEAIRYRHLDNDWLATLEQIRRLEGFEDFLRPSPLIELQKAAINGPVVILNASKEGCAALIMTSSNVVHVPLPRCTLNNLRMLVKMVRSALGYIPSFSNSQVNELMEEMRGFPEAINRENRLKLIVTESPLDDDAIFQNILAMLWKSIVEPVIHALALEKSEQPKRLWWCPTGPFVHLPIHAAGMYGTECEEAVSNYVVSSYTPTLGALLRPPPPTDDPFKMVVVVQSETPGHAHLLYAHDELLKIKDHVPTECLVTLGVPGALASVESVLDQLSNACIVHFACHGIQDTHHPLNSALVLEDGLLTITRIMEAFTPNASLAFLNACQTATGDENLPDEAIHIAASLLFAGFHGVVATMWSIVDQDGPKVTSYFYDHLFHSNVPDTVYPHCTLPDTTNAAQALHIAVAKLRAGKCSFKRWVPFIHLGL